VKEIDAGHRLEHFAGDMGRGSDSSRRQIDLAGIGLGVGDEFGNGPGRNRRVHFHDQGHANNAHDRHDVADEVKAELEHRRIDGICRGNQQQRIAVGRCPHDRLGGNAAAGATAVLDDE
jgi:hypothetical protein